MFSDPDFDKKKQYGKHSRHDGNGAEIRKSLSRALAERGKRLSRAAEKSCEIFDQDKYRAESNNYEQPQDHQV